jgi:hypothetical protein
LITKLDINDTIELLKMIQSNNNWLYTIKYDTASSYLLESSSDTSTEINHQELIKMIEENYKQYNLNFKLDYLANQV